MTGSIGGIVGNALGGFAGSTARLAGDIAQAGLAATPAYSGANALYSQRNSQSNAFPQEVMFPSDLVSQENQFYIALKFEKFVRRSINQQAFPEFQNGIKLPIPNNLRDEHSANYEEQALNPVMGSVLEAAQRTEVSGNGLASDLISRVTGMANLNTASNLGAAIGAQYLQNNTSGQISGAFSSLTGLAINPFLSILYKSPNMKSHQFSWKFIPRDEAESQNIRDIIKLFQYHMLPGVDANSGLFLTYPSMVNIILYPRTDYLYKFKPCVVKSTSVNYAAGGNPSFYKRTNAPSVIDFSVQLQEIEYWTNQDITGTRS